MHGEGSRRFVDFDGITLAMKVEEEKAPADREAKAAEPTNIAETQ
jgi:hypothetical protein